MLKKFATMSFVQRIGVVAGGLLGILILIGLMLPSTGRVQRHIDIDAPAATIFALVNDFHRVGEWSPWAAADPNARIDISGPRRGVGARIDWSGPILGAGSQEIVSSIPYERVTSLIDLGDSDGNGVTTYFEMLPGENGTRTSWHFETDFGWNLFARYFGLMLDGIVGPDYEQGLQNLKEMAERLPHADFGDINIEQQTVESLDIVFLTTRSEPDSAAIADALGDAYFKLLNFIDQNDLRSSGAPMSIGGTFDGAELTFNAAIPVRSIDGSTLASRSNIQVGSSYAGKVIRVQHVGSYRTLGETHDKIAAYLAALGIQRNGEAWESYVTDPTTVSEEELLTYVYYPIIGPDTL